MSKKMIFFTIRDFVKDGGGAIRIRGIVNALAKRNISITLISNAVDYSRFHSSIKHIKAGVKFSKKEKRLFQFQLAFSPNFFVKLIFNKKYKLFKKLCLKYTLTGETIVFFENLDNSIAYFLTKHKLIKEYINDTHGIAPLEFSFKQKWPLVNNFINRFKSYIYRVHDQRVLSSAHGIIFVSQMMKDYYESEYDLSKIHKIFIVPDGASESYLETDIDNSLLAELNRVHNTADHDIVLFAGAFKALGGVLDLVQAFVDVLKVVSTAKLILIGEGEEYARIMKLIHEYNLHNHVALCGMIPYEKLKTYQQIATVIVCPDRAHPYSDMVPHIKYFDSLASGKIVINGKFKCLETVNIDQGLSLEFEASNIADLAASIIYAIQNKKQLERKYRNNVKLVQNKYLYDSNIDDFINLME